MRRLALFCVIAVAGCFTLDLNDGTVKCNGQSCPEGLLLRRRRLLLSQRPYAAGPRHGDDVAAIRRSDAHELRRVRTRLHMLSNVATADGVTCSSGHCDIPASACRAGFAHCSSNPDDGCETDLSQASHCGSCNACPAATPLCSASGSGTGSYTCTASCQSPTPDLCGTTCTNLQSDPNHCKTCDTTCSYPHAGALCTQGTCSLGTCQSGYMDCNATPQTDAKRS